MEGNDQNICAHSKLAYQAGLEQQGLFINMYPLSGPCSGLSQVNSC